MFSESLTVRILGDSSHLQRELEGALSLLAGFRESVSSIALAGQSAVEGLSAIGGASAPLQQISKLIATITRQLQVLSQTAVTINVAPALGALQRLLSMVELVAARLRMVSGAAGIGREGTPAAASAPAAKVSDAFPAAGVSGPVTTGRAVQAGTFDAARQLAAATGFDLLSELQPGRIVRGGAGSAEIPEPPLGRRAMEAVGQAVTGPTTTNHFGGITINVRETADVNGVVRDLRLQGIHLRNRRG